jgi:hypothetical protein
VFQRVRNKPHKNSRSFYFIEISRCGAYYIPSKMTDKLLHLALLTTKKEAQCLLDLFRFWRKLAHLSNDSKSF